VVAIAITKVSSARAPRRSLPPALRNLIANGIHTSPRAIGRESFPNGLFIGLTNAVVGTLMVKVTVVAPDPAVIGLGLNVALAPEGSPATFNWMACGKVKPFGGTTDNVNTACPPGETLTLLLEPAVVIDKVPIVSVTGEEDVTAA
jgi:hypothetical protein